VLDAGERVSHHRGVTDLPGLYFLGLYWQHTRGSALLGWVKDDAEYIATQIQTLANSRDRRRTAANRAHPDTRQSQKEALHVEPQ
jgi:putative flavoprotein involved in K+ transport